MGIDLNSNALEKARELNIGYSYEETFVDVLAYPIADLCLAYTVFLHLDNSTLNATLNKLLYPIEKKGPFSYFIICEILGREWRRDGLPPVFCRERQEYINIMTQFGFDLYSECTKPYLRYVNSEQFRDKKNKNISFLVFKRSN